MNNEWDSTEEFTGYLRGKLIPDLRESGSDATADDFEDAAEFIEILVEQLDEQGDLIDELIEVLDAGQETADCVAGNWESGSLDKAVRAVAEWAMNARIAIAKAQGRNK
jgi:hypothetical protein